MPLESDIQREIEASIAVKQSLLANERILLQVELISDHCLSALRAGGKVIFAGNGGSFADAQHLAAEFVSRFKFDRRPLSAVALGTNSSVFSAVGNDYGFAEVFDREIEALASAGDIFLPISTSGNSQNILAAVRAAKSLNLKTFGFTGKDGGLMGTLCDCIHVPSADTARIQECHIMFGHILCGLIEKAYFGHA